MLQCFPRRDALFGIVDKDLAEEIEEELVEVGVLRDDIFQPSHAPHKFPRLAGCVGHGILEMTVLEKAGC